MISAALSVMVGTGPTSDFSVFLWVIVIPLAVAGYVIVGAVREWLDERRGRQPSSRRPSTCKSSGRRRRRPPRGGKVDDDSR